MEPNDFNEKSYLAKRRPRIICSSYQIIKRCIFNKSAIFCRISGKDRLYHIDNMILYIIYIQYDWKQSFFLIEQS